MDKKLKDEIISAVIEASAQVQEMYNEKYLSPRELCNQFQMITPSWLKEHGHKLPRAKISATDGKGRITGTRYAYPQHKIARMIALGHGQLIL